MTWRRRAVWSCLAVFVALAPLAGQTPWFWAIPESPLESGTIIVSQAHPLATDTDNPIGTRSKPRRTIPNPLPAGAVVELTGPYATSQSSPNRLVLNGTPEQPIVIRTGGFRPAVIMKPWEVTGTSFTLDGLKFQAASLIVLAPSRAVRLRNLELAGNGQDCYGLAFASYDAADRNTDLVLSDSYIHDQGDVHASFDQDCHGVGIAARVDHLWLLRNEFAFNSGDGVQINGGVGGQLVTHHIFGEDNVSHDNKQSGYWVKQASVVVWLRNKAYNHRAGNSSLGQCAGQQYGPADVWWILNELWNCDRGLVAFSDAGAPLDGLRLFAIENNIHDIRSPNPGDPLDVWQPCAISLQGAKQRYVFSNRVTNADCGFAANGNAKQQTFTFQNRAINVARPTVGPMVERTQALVDSVRAFYQEQVK